MSSRAQSRPISLALARSRLGRRLSGCALSMRKYRLICFDAETGRTKDVTHFEAETDELAFQAGEVHRGGAPAELWRAYQALKRWQRRERQD